MMAIRTTQHQTFLDICREEVESATKRIEDRLGDLESKPGGNREDRREDIRLFFEWLADKTWTEPDEECLETLAGTKDTEIMAIIRDGFRMSPVIPIPSFRYLVGLAKRPEPKPQAPSDPDTSNGVSAVDRERLANLLDEQLRATADTLISRLGLEDPKCSVVREVLEDAQGNIISNLTPLV
jgi:hypothetical protein